MAHSGALQLVGGRAGTRLQVLFRGPRLKAGVDLGHVHATVNPVTGRMTYR